MKILILTDSFPPNSLGGADKIAFWQARELKKRGFEVLVVTTVKNKEKEGESFYGGLKVFNIYSSYHERWRAYVSLYNFEVVNKVKNIIDNFKPNIVHAHNIHFYLSYACLKVSKKSGAKVFLTAHDVMSIAYGKLPINRGRLLKNDFKLSFWDRLRQAKKRFNPFREVIIKYYLRHVDKILAVSRALKEALNQNGINNVDVLHNGIDLSDWPSVSKDEINNFKNKFNLNNKKIILFGGRLSYKKGAESVINALKNIPRAVLLVLGENNNYVENLKNKFKKDNILDRIIFIGWIEGRDLLLSYAASDVVCVPSLYVDPFPTVNLEAMAVGKPVVGTCFGGTKEAVIHNRTGYVVDPFDTEKLFYYINDLVNNNKKAENFGEEGHIRVKDIFLVYKWLNKILDYYNCK